MARADLEIHVVCSNYPPVVTETWYRWVTPDGDIWAESRNPAEIMKGQAKRLKLRLYVQVIYRVTGAWREVVDVQLPDPGVLPA